MKTAYALNFSRSAVAPVISAGVMIANVIWNAQNRMNGMVRKLEERVRRSARCPTSLQEREVEVPDQAAVAGVTEREAEHDARPEDREDPHGEDVLHEHAEHVLAADHAAVEEREARCHEQHQSGRDQHPCGIARVHVASSVDV